MAINYLSKVYSANPYVVPVDLNLMASVLSYKDKTFKKNAAQLEAAFQQMGAANVKPSARKYVADKVQGLINNVNGLGSVDLGNDTVVGQIENMASDIYSDPIIIKQISTKAQIDAIEKQYQEAAKDPKKSNYSPANHNNFSRKAAKWLQNPDLEADWTSDHKAYTPYFNIDKFAAEIGDKFKANLKKVEGTSGLYINTVTKEYITADRIKRYEREAIMNNPEAYAQAKINAEETNPGFDAASANEVLIKNYRDNKINLSGEIQEIDKQIATAKSLKQTSKLEKLQAYKEDLQNSLNSVTEGEAAYLRDSKKEGFWTDGMLSQINRDVYIDKVASMYAGVFSYEKVQQELSKDDAKSSLNTMMKDAADKNLRVIDNGDGTYSFEKDWDNIVKEEQAKAAGKAAGEGSSSGGSNPVGTITSSTLSSSDIPNTTIVSNARKNLTNELKSANDAVNSELKAVVEAAFENARETGGFTASDVATYTGKSDGEINIKDASGSFISNLSRSTGGRSSELEVSDILNADVDYQALPDGSLSYPVLRTTTGNYTLTPFEEKLIKQIQTEYQSLKKGDDVSDGLPANIASRLDNVHTNVLKRQTIKEVLDSNDDKVIEDFNNINAGSRRTYDPVEFEGEKRRDAREAMGKMRSITYNKVNSVVSDSDENPDGVVIIALDSDEETKTVAPKYSAVGIGETIVRTMSEDSKKAQRELRQAIQNDADVQAKTHLRSLEISPSNPGYFKATYVVDLGTKENPNRILIEDSKVQAPEDALSPLGMSNYSVDKKDYWTDALLRERKLRGARASILMSTHADPVDGSDKVMFASDYNISLTDDNNFQGAFVIPASNGKTYLASPTDLSKSGGKTSSAGVKRTMKNTINALYRAGANKPDHLALVYNKISESAPEVLDQNQYPNVTIKFSKDKTGLHSHVLVNGQFVNIIKQAIENNSVPREIQATEEFRKYQNGITDFNIERRLIAMMLEYQKNNK